jgi:hypothetical protein
MLPGRASRLAAADSGGITRNAETGLLPPAERKGDEGRNELVALALKGAGGHRGGGLRRWLEEAEGVVALFEEAGGREKVDTRTMEQDAL